MVIISTYFAKRRVTGWCSIFLAIWLATVHIYTERRYYKFWAGNNRCIPFGNYNGRTICSCTFNIPHPDRLTPRKCVELLFSSLFDTRAGPQRSVYGGINTRVLRYQHQLCLWDVYLDTSDAHHSPISSIICVKFLDQQPGINRLIDRQIDRKTTSNP